MSRLRALCVAFCAIVAVSAMATSLASAEEGFLPRNTNGISIDDLKSGTKAILETEKKSKITCETLTGSGTLVSDKHADEVTLDFHGCKALGFEVESLGDLEGLILVDNALALICLLSGGGFGLIIELDEELHLEVLAAATLILVKGSVVGEVKPVGAEPTKHWEVIYAQSGAGKQSITSCVDKTNHKLEAKFGSGVFEGASEAAEGLFLLEEAMELMDS